MTAQEVATLIGVGLFGGAWNSVAGGATLFTFPALMATDLPPVVANATNVLALSIFCNFGTALTLPHCRGPAD